MTDKELQKLGRRELLQLLLDQAKETEQLRAGLAAAGERAQEMEDTFERLRERLNEKDAQIRDLQETYDRLRDRLNEKDARIQELTDTLQAEREGQMTGLGEVGSIAEAALRLNGIFEAAQRAADLYLQKVHESSPLPRGEVLTDVVIDPVWPGSAGPSVPPPSGPVMDVEPKTDYTVQPAPPPAQPVQPAAASPAPPAAEEPQKRGLFQKKKRGDNKGKFVLSFGWEQD